MSQILTEADAKRSLNAHVAEKGAEIREKYGPHLGWDELGRILQDRTCVRYPCEVVFDASRLEPGEFAYPAAIGQHPEEGFKIYVHPSFSNLLEEVPWLVLYQLVLVNYGPFASAEDAETFGAHALGLSQEEYYQRICALADRMGGSEPA